MHAFGKMDSSASERAKDFVERSKDPGSLVSAVKRMMPEAAATLDKQLETFYEDVKLVEQGKKPYSYLRGLHG